jgi:hypothetical protein
MRTVLLVNGPVPPEGREFCPVCVALYRNDADRFFRDQIQAGMRERTEAPLVLDMSEMSRPDPCLAEVVSISILPQLGLLRICWGHVAPAQLSALPPAMQGQMQGVPSLGG